EAIPFSLSSRCFLIGSNLYATVDQIITHLNYMVDKAGIEHVGFGSDFDGIDTTGELVDYTGFDKVIDAMHKHYNEDQIDMLLHGNVLRAMEDIIGK
ncbi:MAG: membrane dipeptidase, partial [Clostridia bacterium]